MSKTVVTLAQAKAALAEMGFTVKTRRNSEFGVVTVLRDGQSMPSFFDSLESLQPWKAVGEWKARHRIEQDGWVYVIA